MSATQAFTMTASTKLGDDDDPSAVVDFLTAVLENEWRETWAPGGWIVCGRIHARVDRNGDVVVDVPLSRSLAGRFYLPPDTSEPF